MYPRNAASPPRIAIGPVVQISDGAVQTSGCTVRVISEGQAEADGGGTTSYSTDGVVCYVPTQAETNYAAFVLIAKKTGCIPSSVSVVTTASATAGIAIVPDTQKVDLNTIKTQTVTCAGGVTVPAATLASTTNITSASGVTLTATTGLGNQTANITGNLSGSVGSVTGAVGSVATDIGLYAHGAVWVDTVNGAAGTASYVNGIPSNPCSTIAAAKTIADNLKLKRFWAQAGSAITLGSAYVGYCFDGRGYSLDFGTRDISKSQFDRIENLTGTGTCGTGEAVIFDSHLGAITVGEADFTRCHLNGTVTMSQASVPYLFHGCAGVGALGKITFAAAGQSAVVAKWSGALIIAGMVAGNTLFLDGNGDVTFDNTCTGGTVYISGNIRLTNNGAGLSITDSSRYAEDQTTVDSSGVATLLSRVVGTVAAGTHNPQSGDAYARLGAPAHTTIAGDIAFHDADVLTNLGDVAADARLIKTLTLIKE